LPQAAARRRRDIVTVNTVTGLARRGAINFNTLAANMVISNGAQELPAILAFAPARLPILCCDTTRALPFPRLHASLTRHQPHYAGKITASLEQPLGVHVLAASPPPSGGAKHDSKVVAPGSDGNNGTTALFAIIGALAGVAMLALVALAVVIRRRHGPSPAHDSEAVPGESKA